MNCFTSILSFNSQVNPISSVQSLSCVQLFVTPWTAACPVHHQLLELIQTHAHQVGDAIQPSHPVIPFSSHLQSFPASGSFPVSQFFTSVLHIFGHIRWPKYWSFSFSITPSNEHPGLISFRMDWLDLLAV